MKTIIKMVSTGLYTGYSPICPGTIASILGLLIYLQLKEFPVIYISVVALLFITGFFVSSRAEDIFKEKDSRRIVIDEIASMCLVCLFVKPSPAVLGIAFVVFRAFDIIKPPPARRIERCNGAKGVMLDDVIAAFYTIAVLFILYYFTEAGILPRVYR